MTMLWTSQDIAHATGGLASADFSVGGIAFDSREVGAGDLFVAMTGENDDGHRFVDRAFAKGAGGAIVSTPVPHPHVLVADTAAALNALGVASRARTVARVAGITGSVGKTGTKEALAAALSRTPDAKVHRSVKSYNNHTGVPLSLARMPADSDYGVFEMGMNHAGEIAALTAMVRPHVALITAIAPAHIEFFESEAAIADAKGEIFAALEPGGTAIIPFDSPHRDRLMAHARPYAEHILTFGLGAGADVRAHQAVATARGSLITARLPDTELCFTVAQHGAHWVSNALAVIATVSALGADLAVAGLALAELESIAGRGARFTLPNGAMLIDESYNANAASMAATLKVLADEPAIRRIAVLGEMRELGQESDALHAGIAAPLLAADVAFVLLVGRAMTPLAEEIRGKVEFRHVADTAAAIDLMPSMIGSGDTVLVKGSNGVGLSALVSALRSA